MGSTTQKTVSQQQQSAQTAPWAPAQPLLQDILGQINTSGAVTPGQSNALSGLQSAVAGLPNFGSNITGLANDYLGGDPTGLLRPALSAYTDTISPLASAPLDPNANPYIRSALDTVQQDVRNSVNGMFAGAGRDLSGLNTQALARGITQAEAPILLNQYQQNIQNRQAAANGLLGAAGTTAGAIGATQQQGANYASQQPGFALNPAQYGLTAANAAYSQPYQNLAQPLALTLPIAGLGSQSSGTATGTSNTTSTPSLGQQIGQGVSIFGNLFGGQFSPVSNFAGLFG